MSKWIEFELFLDTGKTVVIDVKSKKHDDVVLGHIKWYGPWRQYAFFPMPGTLYNQECLRDISTKISELMLERRQGLDETTRRLRRCGIYRLDCVLPGFLWGDGGRLEDE